LEITSLTNQIEQRDGIWFSKNQANISYPNDGNEICNTIEEDSFWFNHRNNCIVNLLNLVDPEGIFLDVGGGNGIVTKSMLKAGFNAFLLEPGIEGIFNAKQNGIDQLICSTLENAGFYESSIPAIGIFDVLEHIEDDAAFLYQIRNNLRNQGKLYLTVPAFQFLWSGDDVRAGHFKRYTLKKLDDILETVGFKTIYSTYIFSILPLPVFAFRKIPTILGLHSNKNLLNKRRKEHLNKDLTILNKIWDYELRQIQKGKKIPVGGSCMLVAEKV